MIEHICKYIIIYFRKYDIARNGVTNIYGVKKAKCESLLEKIEVFVDCILVGFAMNFLI